MKNSSSMRITALSCIHDLKEGHVPMGTMGCDQVPHGLATQIGVDSVEE
jgi:hypothetical protein